MSFRFGFSFRTRLFVMAGLIVSAVLAAVLLLGWNRVMAFEVERLDSRLCIEARRLATQGFRGDDAQRMQTDAVGKLQLAAPDQVMLRSQSALGAVGVQSANWQPALDADTVRWRASSRANLPGPPGPRVDPPGREGDRPSSPQLWPERPPERPPGRPPEGQADRPPERGQLPLGGSCALASWESPALPGAPARQWRAACYTTGAGSGVLAADLAATQAQLSAAFLEALKLVVPLALVLTALGAWLLATLTMRPVNRLGLAMKNVNPQALEERLSSQGEDREFKDLIEAYNTMLARLQVSFQQASRFSADAAHELKTPLTILQGRIEQALLQSEQPAVQKVLTQLLDEVGRLASITRKLLLLSQADAGGLALQLQPIDLSAMLDDIALDAQMLLTHQSLACEIASGLALQADQVLLQQVLNNLISNAVRYCRTGGWIRVSARLRSGSVQVIFSNATVPISGRERAQFFDRFYRGDAAHNRRIDGQGLGLGLARELARAHGGDLELMASESDCVSLRLTLPLSPTSASGL